MRSWPAQSAAVAEPLVLMLPLLSIVPPALSEKPLLTSIELAPPMVSCQQASSGLASAESSLSVCA